MATLLKWKTLLAMMTAALAALVAVALLRLHQKTEPAPETTPGFHDAVRESGIDWQMHFLPAEQGQQFKINLYDHGSGVAVGDYDGDGHDDVYFVNQLGRNALYRNKGDGTFTDVTEEAGVVLGDRICVAATFVDYDNSGRESLFVTSTRGGNVLFKNLGDGKFKDVTKAAGLVHVGHSQACAFFDYDNDGYLDLLLTNTARWTTNQFDPAARYYRGPDNLIDTFRRSPPESNILYHNNGDGTFTDVTAKAGLKGKGWSGDVAILDYDGDGHPDLLVTGMFGGTTLYHNNGNGTFTDVTRKTLGRTSWGAMGCRAFDFNNDGRLDLFIVDMHSDMWMGVKYDWSPAEIAKFKRDEKKKSAPMWHIDVAGLVFRGPLTQGIFGNTFYKNLGKGKFKEMSDKAGLETFWPWGIATGDFDNDGYEDVFIPSGMGYPFFYWPNYLLMNNGDETFTDRAEALGIEPPVRGEYAYEQIGGMRAARSSRAAAVADFDDDGRLDIVVNNFNDYPYYFRNHLPRRNYIAFRLRGAMTDRDPPRKGGRKSNRDAIGAVVTLHVGKQVMTRQVNPASGYLAQSSKTLHLGLGDRSQVDRVEIRWPGGRRQTIENPAVNRLHKIVEGAE